MNTTANIGSSARYWRKVNLVDNQSKDLLQESSVAIERQTTYDHQSKSFVIRCAICNERKIQKKQWLRSSAATLRELRQLFNFCRPCKRWVCEDCFLVDDGNGDGIGICIECAIEQGITGMTAAQFEEAWPELQHHINERREAAQRTHWDKKNNEK